MNRRKAKIVATVGPATSSPEMLERLIAAGVNVVRLNLSHGELAGHAEVVGRVREAAERTGSSVGILLDLQGPRIRTGEVEGDGVELTTGENVTIAPEGEAPLSGESATLTTTYRALAEDVKPGDRILIDDGLIDLRVEGVSNGAVSCVVVFGGVVRSHKGMNLPGVSVSTPSLTDKDREGIEMGVRLEVDYIALSFVRHASDVEELKKILADAGAEIPVRAKIEKDEAIVELDAIIEASDGIMIARGDLGVELSPEKVPVLQKKIIAAANRADRVVITATQMLDSMINNPRPTRAETSDVANAVFDGTDALMLSGETAVGRYPVRTVEIMSRIIKEAEEAEGMGAPASRDMDEVPDCFARAAVYAAAAAATKLNSKAMVIFTQTGTTAVMLSKLRPNTPIVAFTPLERTRRRLSLVWGIEPFAIDFGSHTDEMICRGEAALLDFGLAEMGDTVVIVSGTKVGMRGATNMMKIDWIGSDECKIYLKGDG